ncbi:hypothetical protein BCON_0015g00250 [Botryotinia convoluta]|uniref:Plastocyanin-like domain-containing protein n=1 Tax=Botryotinia convoluta TaxID=54673 RepID=A0A4Z1INV0_9HELO|nr:hypothetical protein BCON_0015g00250 [Botryotinia convoluta]
MHGIIEMMVLMCLLHGESGNWAVTPAGTTLRSSVYYQSAQKINVQSQDANLAPTVVPPG